MKVTFLGVGSGSSLNYYNSNILLEWGNSNLLIDCGTDIKRSAKDYIDKIKNVYISHIHSDHMGGLEYLAFRNYFGGKLPISLIAHYTVIDKLQTMLMPSLGVTSHGIKKFTDYFDLRVGTVFNIDEIMFMLVPCRHIQSPDYTMNMVSFGLSFKTEHGKEIFITTDTMFDLENLKTHYEWAEYILQDCETSKKKSSVHAHYNDLVTLPEDIKKKMILYHYGDDELPDAQEDGFFKFAEQEIAYYF